MSPGLVGLVALYFFEVFLELVKQFFTTLAGHFDEPLLNFRCAVAERLDLLLIELGHGYLVGGFLDLLQGFISQAVDMADNLVEA